MAACSGGWSEYARLYFGYVIQYCSKTLKFISLDNALHSMQRYNANPPDPFQCVEEAEIKRSYFDNNFLHLLKLFPNLRKLVITYPIGHEDSSHIHFPHLEKLTITFEHFASPCLLKDSLDLVRANSQLQELVLEMGFYREFTMTKLLETISQNAEVTKLRVVNGVNVVINTYNLCTFICDHTCMVELDWPTYQITPEDVDDMIGVMEKLKLFRFLISDSADYDKLVKQLGDTWKHQLEITLDGEHLVTLKRAD